MAQNIEIKAHAADFQAQMKIAAALSTREPEIIPQEDVFFNVAKGRLKLRIFSNDSAELIYYTRPDQQGPKVSNYTITPTSDPAGLRSVLDEAYGTRAVVLKTRHLYMSGRTRLHFDEVDQLGHFLELEVVLSQNEDVAGGELEAQQLMHTLGIEPQHLIDGAYVDMLTEQ